MTIVRATTNFWGDPARDQKWKRVKACWICSTEITAQARTGLCGPCASSRKPSIALARKQARRLLVALKAGKLNEICWRYDD